MRPANRTQTNYLQIVRSLTQMTHLRIAEDPGEEFAVRAHNVLTDADENAILFYNDVNFTSDSSVKAVVV